MSGYTVLHENIISIKIAFPSQNYLRTKKCS